jgi:hypothetical protein
MEIVGFFHLFNDNNLTISRGHYNTISLLTGESARRTTEEVDKQCIDCGDKHRDDYEEPTMLWVGKPPGQYADSSPNKKTYGKLVCTLLVKVYFTEFSHSIRYLNYANIDLIS